MKHYIFFLLFSMYFLTSAQDNWIWKNPTPTNVIINDIWLFNSTEALCVGQAGTVIRTTDAGSSWINKNISTKNNLSKIFFVNADIGLIGGEKTFHFTSDGGKNWIERNPPLDYVNDEPYACYDIAANSQGLWIGSSKLLKTTDLGVTWKKIALNQQYSGGINSLTFISDSIGILSTSLGEIFKTTNAGTSWFSVGSAVPRYVKKIRFLNTTTGWMVGKTLYNQEGFINYGTLPQFHQKHIFICSQQKKAEQSENSLQLSRKQLY